MRPPHTAKSRPRLAAGNARSHVLEEIRRRILRLDFPPGAPLSENDLAAQLGTSRTPVRESLILLGEEGLVSVVPQIGTFVAPMREASISTAQFVREALEVAALDQAVGRLSALDRDDLEDLLVAQRRAAARDDHESFFDLDDAFHRRLMIVSGHETAWSVVSHAKAHLDRARRLSLPLPGQLGRLVDEHQAVYDALDGGERDEALAALRTHLRRVFEDVTVIRREHPDFFDVD